MDPISLVDIFDFARFPLVLLRIKIMKNIGLAFVKMGQLADAITSFEYIMAEKADFRSALHLILCHYTLGDRDKMKRCFLKLLDVVLEHVDDEKYETPPVSVMPLGCSLYARPRGRIDALGDNYTT